MNNKSGSKDLGSVNSRALGNFTKGAVEEFENNIVNKVDFLDQVKQSQNSNKENQK